MISEKGKISIRTMSDESGVSIPNIRVWEKRYNLLSPERDSANRRYYTQFDLSRVILNKYLIDKRYRISKISHYTLNELRQVVSDELKNESSGFFEKQKMISLLLDSNIESFDEFLKICLEDIASVDFIIEVLEPVMQLLPVICNLKDNNNYCYSFVANKVMLRMLSSVDDISVGMTDSLEMLIFQSDEKHIPVNLSIVNYLATFKRYRTNILLNRFPNDYFHSLKNEIKPDIVYTEFNEKQELKDIIEVLTILQRAFPLAKVITSGSRLEKIWKSIPNKIYFVRELKVILKSI